MVNWKLGLRRSWIVATGCWVVGLPLYAFRPGQPRRQWFDAGEDVVFLWMVAGPILLLLVLLSVVWATRGFVKE